MMTNEESEGWNEPEGLKGWETIPDEEWQVYSQVLTTAIERELPFGLGGGFAFSLYSRRWRYTKDVDLYVPPEHRVTAIELITSLGFADCHDSLPYDRRWIYRGCKDGLIVDIIWCFANFVTDVDADWIRRGPIVELGGIRVKVLPVEELLWAKIHIVQRRRCDWPDTLSILYQQAASLDWDHLLACIGEDWRLLGGLLSVFAWLCPGRAAQIPSTVWTRVGLLAPEDSGAGKQLPPVDQARVALLDSREWFGPYLAPGPLPCRGR